MKLSILIPAYNRPNELRQLLDSIAWCDLSSECEILVSDDCSPKQNQIGRVVKSMLSNGLRIRYFAQASNLGEVENKNFLLGQAAGEFCIFIGDDDLVVQGSISRLLTVLGSPKVPDLVLLGYYKSDDSLVTRRLHAPRIGGRVKTSGLIRCGALNFDWFPFWYAHPATYAFRRNGARFFQVGFGFAEDLVHLAEYLVDRREVYLCNFPLIFWRKTELNDHKKREQVNQSSDLEKHSFSRQRIFEFVREVQSSEYGPGLTAAEMTRHRRTMRVTNSMENLYVRVLILVDVTKFLLLRLLALLPRV